MAELVTELSESEPTRIGYNAETMLDNFTGSYHIGFYGERLLSGGLYSSVVITGRGNTIKSTTGATIMGRVMERYPSTTASLDDNEESLVGLDRINHLLRVVAPRIVAQRILYNLEKFNVRNGTSKKETSTAKWFDKISNVINARIKKNLKDDWTSTPFLDPMDASGKSFIKRLKLFIAFLDSLSKATIDVTQELIDKAATDSSDQNIIPAREGLIKTRIIREIPKLSGVGGSAWIMTAHMGDKLNFNPLETPQSKLAFISAKVTLKNAPEQVTFLSTYILYSNHLKPLLEKKEEMYPDKSDEFDFDIGLEREVDLMELHMMTLRSKVGLTGVEWAYVISQKDGYLIPLSHYHFIKKYKFGIDGLGGEWVTLYLLPDVKISRTTVRGKAATNPKLVRALEITVAIAIQIITNNRELKQELHHLCLDDNGERIAKPPLQILYEKIEASEHLTWDEIYESREWWAEDHYTNPIKYLSAFDIIRVANGTYIPYWKQPGFKPSNHK